MLSTPASRSDVITFRCYQHLQLRCFQYALLFGGWIRVSHACSHSHELADEGQPCVPHAEQGQPCGQPCPMPLMPYQVDPLADA